MRIISGVVSGAFRLARLQELSKKPGKDLNGLIIVLPIITTFVSSVVITASLIRPSAVGGGCFSR